MVEVQSRCVWRIGGIVLLAVMLVGLTVPVSADHKPTSVDYVTGLGLNEPATGSFSGFVTCDASNLGSPSIGGACIVTCMDRQGDSCTVVVIDDRLGEREFYWECYNDPVRNGKESLVPDDCPNGHVSVYVKAPATTGTITMW